jgi:hypothetical protein
MIHHQGRKTYVFVDLGENKWIKPSSTLFKIDEYSRKPLKLKAVERGDCRSECLRVRTTVLNSSYS